MRESVEQRGAQHEPENKPEAVPYNIAKESGLKSLQKGFPEATASDTASEAEVLDDSGRLKELAGIASRAAKTLKQYAQKLERAKNPNANLIRKTEGLLVRLYDRCLSLSEFTETIQKGKEGVSSGENLELYERAVKQLRDELPELFDQLQNVPIQSGLNPETIKDAVRKILGAAATAGLLGTLLGGDLHREESFDDKLPRNIQRLEKETSGALGAGTLLSRRQSGEEQKPTLAAGKEGEPGSFGKPNPIAIVKESFFSSISDPLWITDVAGRADDRTFRTIPPALRAYNRKAEAEVGLKPMSVVKGQAIVLPAPLGFVPAEVNVKPAVPFTVDEHSSSIIFQGDGKHVSVLYKVFPAHSEYPGGAHTPANLNRTAEVRQMIQELSNMRYSEMSQALSRHLKDFTYIVSDELQAILDEMPGTIEEKVGAIKVGSCNTLSAYAAGLLTDAGRRSFVANGFLQSDNYIDGNRPHSKVILFPTGDVTTAAFETTSAPEKSFVNVIFEANDKVALEEIAATIHANATSTERFQAYEAFGQKLHEILGGENYKRFEPIEKFGGKSESLYRTLRTLGGKLDDFMSSGTKSEQILSGIGMAVAIDLTLVLAAIAAAKALSRAKHEIAEKLKQETNRDLADAFRSLLENSQAPATERSEALDDDIISGHIAAAYKSDPRLEEWYPLQEVQALRPEERRDYYKILHMARVFVSEPWRMFGMASFIVNRSNFQKELERLKADGVSVDKWMERILTNYVDPKQKERLEQTLPVRVQSIMSSGTELAVRKLEKTNGLDSQALFKTLGIGPADESQMRGKSTVSPSGGEFHEHAPYSPGMDTRTIDWNAYARTEELVVKRFAEAKHDKKVPALDVVVDVTDHDDAELAKLVALLLYTQKYKRLDIQSVSFTSYDRAVFRLDKKAISTLMSEGAESIRYLIEKIKKLQLEHNFAMFKKELRENRYHLTRALEVLSPRNLGIDKNATVLGIGTLGGFNFTEHGKTVGSFLVFKKSDSEGEGKSKQEAERQAAKSGLGDKRRG